MIKRIPRHIIKLIICGTVNVFLVIAASLFLSDLISGIIFSVEFISLRALTGCLKSKNYFINGILFLGIFFTVYYINFVSVLIDQELLSMLLTVLILLGIIPVLALNSAQNKSDKFSRICRIIRIAVYILISITALALHYGGIKYGSFMILTLTAVSVLILIEIFKSGRKIQ